MPISETGRSSVDLAEAARQLEQAAHDAQVAYDCISLGDLEWAHTNAITACAEANAAENAFAPPWPRTKKSAGAKERSAGVRRSDCTPSA
jgi:hypothetical protein